MFRVEGLRRNREPWKTIGIGIGISRGPGIGIRINIITLWEPFGSHPGSISRSIAASIPQTIIAHQHRGPRQNDIKPVS